MLRTVTSISKMIKICPMENDVNSLVMIIGGETIASRENEHSNSVEIIGPNGLCR